MTAPAQNGAAPFWKVTRRDGRTCLQLSRGRMLLLWLSTAALLVLVSLLVHIIPSKGRGNGFLQATKVIAGLVAGWSAMVLRRHWQRENAAGPCLLEIDSAARRLRLPRQGREFPLAPQEWHWRTAAEPGAALILTNLRSAAPHEEFVLPLPALSEAEALGRELTAAGIPRAAESAAGSA